MNIQSKPNDYQFLPPILATWRSSSSPARQAASRPQPNYPPPPTEWS